MTNLTRWAIAIFCASGLSLMMTNYAGAESEISAYRAKLEKWVEARETLSKERADWLVDKEYLLVTSPEGTVRVGLLTPGVCADETGANCDGFQREAEKLPYCLQYDGPAVPGMLMPNPFQCRYADENFAIWPAVEQRGVFATTRVTETVQALPPECSAVGGPNGPLPTTDCYNWVANDEVTYYVTQIEDFTAFIDHTMTATALGLSYSCALPDAFPRLFL